MNLRKEEIFTFYIIHTVCTHYVINTIQTQYHYELPSVALRNIKEILRRGRRPLLRIFQYEWEKTVKFHRLKNQEE